MAKYLNIQEYLNNTYNKNTEQIIFDNPALQLSEKGELVISDYPNLEEIYVTGSEHIKINNITKVTINNCPKVKKINITTFVDNKRLEINNCPNLEILYCRNNNLTNLDFLNNLNPKKLERLSLDDNNFPKQDLTIFTKFKELKILAISGITKSSYFCGSLKPLQELKKLETLNINGTDITHGLEFLPYNVKNIDCSPVRPNAKVTDIHEELQSFGGDINK
ncbi:16721_t:CDS:1 [Funneliformis geosporum]|uniref:16721_t:CDS:1 n=1 Tax=Funneliformis geosporum TaxID=1117311 RepID=A0A9W4TB94_9GLOM|nr:16721_t:CDS:1 [Funneliformis geosporum]